MTGLEKIVQQIRDEAQQAADAVIAQAKEEAGQLAAKAAEDARTQSGAILAKSKTDVQNHLAAARSAAGSSSVRPPMMLRYASHWLTFSPPRFSSTASSIAARL